MLTENVSQFTAKQDHDASSQRLDRQCVWDNGTPRARLSACRFTELVHTLGSTVDGLGFFPALSGDLIGQELQDSEHTLRPYLSAITGKGKRLDP